MKKFISIFITALLLVNFLSVNSFALDNGNLDFYANDCYYYSEYYDSQNGVYVSQNVTKSIISFSGVECVQYTIPRASGNYNRFTNIYDIKNLHANHEYTLKFSYFLNPLRNYGHLLVTFQILNANGSPVQNQVLYTGSTGISSLTDVEFNFVPDLSNVQAGYQTRLNFEFIQESNTQDYNCLLSNYIYFNDNDDNSSLLESIIQWIENVITAVSNAGSSIVSSITNLRQNISVYFTNLGNDLNTWLTGVKDGITNKLESVKTSIQNSINNIQNWFINLGDRISDFFTMLKNYLLYFRHPVTVNAEGVPVDSSGNPIYINPFQSSLNSVKTQFEQWIDNINDFIDSIDSSADSVSTQLSTFKLIFERFSAAVPWISGIILFAVIFFVIRKIVGR